MYRTGDRVRLDENGMMTFVGRADDQIKVRGFRVEPREVAVAIESLTGVIAAYVVPLTAPNGFVEDLVAVVIPAGGAAGPDERSMHSQLMALLPSYMVPTYWVFREDVPRTPHGKVDVRSLGLSIRDEVLKSHGGIGSAAEEG